KETNTHEITRCRGRVQQPSPQYIALKPGTWNREPEPGTGNREPGTGPAAPGTCKPFHWAHAADIPDDTAAHWAAQHDWLVVRVCAGDRLCGGLLAGRGVWGEPGAGVFRGFFPFFGGGGV